MSESLPTRSSLLVRLRDPRDEQAWAEFVEVYTPLILRVAMQTGLQRADADDLAQDVFRAVAGAIGRWDPDPRQGTLRGWLFRIARNLSLNLLASRKHQAIGSGDSAIADLLDQQPAPDAQDTAWFDEEYRRSVFRWATGRIRGEFHDWPSGGPPWRARARGTSPPTSG
jgi:DNA-directed RNA polymerase specialized sigma24 family protein